MQDVRNRSQFEVMFPIGVCQYSEWQARGKGLSQDGVYVANARDVRRRIISVPEYVYQYAVKHYSCKKVAYVVIANTSPKPRKAKRSRKNKHAEFLGLTPMQIDFLVNMVNDENWIGADSTKLSMPEYITYLEKEGILNRMQSGMMLTVLRNKGLVASEKLSDPEYGELTVYFHLTEDGVRIFERLLDYCIKSDRINLFDPSMTAKQLM